MIKIRSLAIVFILGCPMVGLAQVQDLNALVGRDIGLLSDSVYEKRVVLNHAELSFKLRESKCKALLMPRGFKKGMAVTVYVCEEGRNDVQPFLISYQDHETLLKWRADGFKGKGTVDPRRLSSSGSQKAVSGAARPAARP